MLVLKQQRSIEMDEALMLCLLLLLLWFELWGIDCLFRHFHDLLPIQRKFLLNNRLFLSFLLLSLYLLRLLLLLHILRLVLLLRRSFIRNDLPTFNAKPHIVGTERRCALIQMKTHVLSSILAEVESSFDLLRMQSAIGWQMCENRKIVDFSFEFFLLEESIGEDIHVVQQVQKISAQFAETHHPEHAQFVPNWVLFWQEIRSILECDLLVVGNNLWYVSKIVKHKLRKRDNSSSAPISISLLIKFTLELDLHQRLTDFVLSTIVSTNDRANRISEEGIEEGLAVIGGKRVEAYVERVLLFLRELPIRLHAYIMKELIQSSHTKSIFH